MADFDLQVFGNGTWNPALLYQWDAPSSTWVRKYLQGTVGTQVPAANSVTVSAPLANSVISTTTFTPVATVRNGVSVILLLDGTTDLGETQQNGINWSIPSRRTGDLAPGTHTIVAVATYADGSTGTSSAVTFAISATSNPDPGVDGATTSLVSITQPDSSLAVPTMSGSYKIRAFVDPTLGAVSAVDFAVGSVADRGYQPGVSLGAGLWEIATPLDTVNFQASVAEAGSASVAALTASDIWYDIRAKATLADTTVRFSPYVRALGRNRQPSRVGVTPTWKPAKDWQADFSGTMSTFVHSFDKVQTAGPNAGKSYQATGGVYGKELGAGTLVPDPDASNSYGHVAFPTNVLLWNVPNTYGAQTAGTVNSYTGGTYGSLGDQATSGSVRGQVNTPSRYVEGDQAAFGYAFRIDPQFPTPTTSHISIGQIYGNANGGDPDWGIFLMLDAQQKTAEHGDTVPDTWQIWGNRFNRYERAKLFSMPFYRGKWVSIVYVVGHSTDAQTGWLEIYSAQPGVNGGALTQWTFPSGAVRLALVTLPELSDGQPFHAHIYRGLSTNGKPWPDTAAIRAHFYGMRTGKDAAAVNPQTYGSSIIYATATG